MSKSYLGRYLTARLCKRSLNSSDAPKGRFYSIRQLSKGASPAKDLATVTGSENASFMKVQIPQKKHQGVALRVFTSQLSLTPSAIVFPS
ncbi:hypothetical protein AVEN_180849-1 [Araneus ventricosus]|uniref:Uncharacterized protein n=1 Tax=Araneus ventricosus TaxID=182803 RepID=A0A4Y2HAU9_ARAVE|nr:hypothetical protein AVEN_180849-1 [Araneus ventricosus]